MGYYVASKQLRLLLTVHGGALTVNEETCYDSRHRLFFYFVFVYPD